MMWRRNGESWSWPCWRERKAWGPRWRGMIYTFYLYIAERMWLSFSDVSVIGDAAFWHFIERLRSIVSRHWQTGRSPRVPPLAAAVTLLGDCCKSILSAPGTYCAFFQPIAWKLKVFSLLSICSLCSAFFYCAVKSQCWRGVKCQTNQSAHPACTTVMSVCSDWETMHALIFVSDYTCNDCFTCHYIT